MIRLEDRKAGKGAATRRELSVYRSTAVNSTIIQLLAVRPELSSDFSSQIP